MTSNSKWTLRIIALAALAGLGFWGVAAAVAQAPAAGCMERAKMLAYVLQKYDESPVYFGTLGNEAKMAAEVTVSPTGSWSMIGTNPEGLSCIMVGGLNWEQTGDIKLPGRES